MSWTQGAFLGFDTETTGVDVEKDRIVTAALVHRDAAGTRVRSWLLDPGVEIPAAATAIHGISTEYAQAHGTQPDVALEEIATALAESLELGIPVVAFNASFDLCLLDAELRRHGLATLPERLGRAVAPVIDPLVLDRAEAPYRRGKRKLSNLCGVYEVTDNGDLHTADVDVVATLDVLAEIVRHYPRLGELSLDALHDFQISAHRRWAEGFNAWRSERGLPGPGAELTWPAREGGRPVREGGRPVREGAESTR
jgi:DNA polymerase-3 subunit epsilon